MTSMVKFCVQHAGLRERSKMEMLPEFTEWNSELLGILCGILSEEKSRHGAITH